jgi:hypothetical protein
LPLLFQWLDFMGKVYVLLIRELRKTIKTWVRRVEVSGKQLEMKLADRRSICLEWFKFQNRLPRK